MNKKRRAIFEKSGGRCWYCGCRLEEKGWHADHFEPIRRNWTDGTCIHPELDTEENKVPACGSCNIQKGSLSLESFRNKISGFINSLNQYHSQYAVAKRYGLIEEQTTDVVFWFEKQEQ
ncbi:HNH endonuclease [Exiguobacterium sp. 8H]|uniref:HNH endonuclease n=1 Tax=Exiguobacterium sp. 8H TaxID=2653140 RepID=UPI0012F2B86D|nr:HNH endonuclease signature motif containing protein [Exiguobacterium sp. 8H]VXB83319.1 HNH endonuclease [Exiguobacterium sp. 8H]